MRAEIEAFFRERWPGSVRLAAALTGDRSAAEDAAGRQLDQVRPAMNPVLDAATSPVPLDQLADVVQLTPTAATLQAAANGSVALRLTAPQWPPGFEPGVVGEPDELGRHWLVSTIDAHHVVWGVVPASVTRIEVTLGDGQVVTGDTVRVGPQDLDAAVFAVNLPDLASISGLAGQDAGGTTVLVGTDLEASLAPVAQIGPEQWEHTAFVSVTAP